MAKRRKRIAKISTVDGCSLEMQRLYRLARREELDLDRAKSLVHILKTISSLIMENDFDKRLEALEEMR